MKKHNRNQVLVLNKLLCGKTGESRKLPLAVDRFKVELSGILMSGGSDEAVKI